MDIKTPSVQTSTTNNCLPIGYQLHEFEIKGVIGEGGFGIVYLAYDHQLHRMLAIKEYMPVSLAKRLNNYSIALREERFQHSFDIGLKSFEQEARSLAQFSHPSLLHVFRFWNSNSTSYMAMQLYSGITLKKYRDEFPEKIDEGWLKTIIPPLLGAIDTLHQAGYIHLDIAMDNILIQEESGLPVLLDFGSTKKAINNLDNQSEVVLKPGYAPIEQYAKNNGQLGPWTDIYALGAVLHSLITGNPPPVSMIRCIEDTYVPLTQRQLANYSSQFLNAIDQTLLVNLEQRTQNIKQFADNMGLSIANVADIISHKSIKNELTSENQFATIPSNQFSKTNKSQKKHLSLQKKHTNKSLANAAKQSHETDSSRNTFIQQIISRLNQHNLVLDILAGLSLLTWVISYLVT